MNIIFKKFNSLDSELWEKTNLDAESSSFLSSIHWINFQKSLGKETDQYFIYAESENASFPVGVLYIEIYRRKIAKFAYSPYGPVLNLKAISMINPDLSIFESYKLFLKEFKRFCKKYVSENELNLFRFDPLINSNYKEAFIKTGFSKTFAATQAMDVWEMDISKSEDEILKALKKDTRYYIKRATKIGVEIVKARTEEEVFEFVKLMSQTTERKDFANYSSDYFINQWKALNEIGMTEIYLAKYQDKYISGALFNFYKDTAYYAHGASTSDSELMKISSPYLLHFEIMKDVKERNITKYNFWGVVPKEIKNHPWRGLSDFKMKFPGSLISYSGGFEIGSNFLKFNLHRLSDFLNYKNDRYR